MYLYVSIFSYIFYCTTNTDYNDQHILLYAAVQLLQYM